MSLRLSGRICFVCGVPARWLDEGEEDGKIVRELKPHEEYNTDILEKQRVCIVQCLIVVQVTILKNQKHNTVEILSNN